ncbi:MAG TPA: ABC transporter permease, partial [Steroidobacteraceae bacterium]|nr:ABC transporter permease [Steroidobacteraceae bacterium]
VYATQSLAVARRRREIALLHAMGVTVREQLGAALLSGALVGALGAVLGLLLGIAVARVGLATFGADLGAGYFRGLAARLEVHPLECAAFFALGVAAAVLATIGPAREAASVPAAVALRAGDEAPIAARRHGRAALALALLALAALALPSLDGIALPGYAAIAGLLLAAVFITPSLAALLLTHLPESGAAWRQVAVAQLRGTARQSTVSIAAILVSFALMVAMAIMVFSFRMSLEDWLQRVLPADLYVRAGLPGQSAYLEPDDERVLASIAGIARVDLMRRQEVGLVGGGPPVLILARSIDERSVSSLLPLVSVDDHAAPPEAVPVWVSEAVSDLHGLHVGALFDLPLGGRVVRASVRGVWRDYERPTGVIVIPREAYLRYTADGRATSVALWLAPGVEPDVVAGRIRERLGRAGEYDIAVPRTIRRATLGVFDRTFAVTYLLEAVAVLIGLFGISTSTSAQVLARRAEFGMLRHLGITRAEIGRMLALEGAVLGCVGVAAGLVVGAAVSLILVYVVNRQSFHWSMDVHVPWVLLATLSAALVVAAALTAAASGRQAMGGDVVRAVKEDW